MGYTCRPCGSGGNFERLEGIATSELNKTLIILKAMVQCSSRDRTIDKISIILERRKRQSGIHIVMSCGEEHHVHTTQSDVKEIYVQGERIYPLEVVLPPRPHYNDGFKFSPVINQFLIDNVYDSDQYIRRTEKRTGSRIRKVYIKRLMNKSKELADLNKVYSKESLEYYIKLWLLQRWVEVDFKRSYIGNEFIYGV